MQRFLGKEILENALLKHISKTDFLLKEYKREKAWGIENLSKYYIKDGAEYFEITLCFPEKAFEYRVFSRFNLKTNAYVIKVRERVIELSEKTFSVVITPTFCGVVEKIKSM